MVQYVYHALKSTEHLKKPLKMVNNDTTFFQTIRFENRRGCNNYFKFRNGYFSMKKIKGSTDDLFGD
jgi:hypothetical protein